MRLARWIFAIAAVWGVIILTPLYFLESRIAELAPPAIAHPEYYYGFTGAALCFQLLYATIAYDPVRYRPLMLLGVLGKLSFAVPCAALFVVAWLATGRAQSEH